jgi:sarcosine oxidase subunit alpha
LSESKRLGSGGAWLDRGAPLDFTFDGRGYTGLGGDTLASALLANGVDLVARSFKYHRPRGVVGLGAEEPSALVTIGAGDRAEPNARATMVPLAGGLAVSSQNCWPNLELDCGALVRLASPILKAGFYYKTFLWPAGAWPWYEKSIRRMAGLGPPPKEPDPDRYDKRHAFADVLVIGAGPAGLAAAIAAGRSGASVLIADEHQAFAASLAGTPNRIDGMPAERWAAAIVDELQSLPRVTCLKRATVVGAYDHGFLVINERLTPSGDGPRERIWKVRARQVVLASGATERSIAFGGNDRPGIMMASAVRGYLRRFAVLCGRRAVIFTNNDSAYATAQELAAAGADAVTVIDCRPVSAAAATAAAAGIEVIAGAVVSRALGRRRLRGVELRDGTSGRAQRLDCDLLCVSGGWNPNVHLFSQNRGQLRWEDTIGSFVPEPTAGGFLPAGACNGIFDLAACIADGMKAGSMAAQALGLRAPADRAPLADGEPHGGLQPLWLVPGKGSKFVDFQNDVTVADIALAVEEGYRSAEHLKRYTTLGMGTDQGKLGNVNGLAVLAGITSVPVAATGTTTFRPPYTPVTVGAVAAHETGELGHPRRRTAAHERHVRDGAIFMEAGQWQRPACYPRPGEDSAAAVRREMTAVRAGVGLVDVATVGKIEVRGRDAADFLERVYINALRDVQPGRGRYGVMLREDGMVFDDGIVMRLAEDHFYLTTSTANAEAVFRHLEFVRQVRWPESSVFLTAVTEHWFAAALNGPRARQVLSPLCDFAIDGESLPLMAIREGQVSGIPARVMRISFSGELAYEICVPADAGEALWDVLAEAGENHGLVIYGVDAMSGLRIEKGHCVVGAEIDGRTTPDDLGLGRLVRKSGDFIGRRSLRLRPPPAAAGRQLVGVVGETNGPEFPAGAHVVAEDRRGAPQAALGPVTSWTWSPALNRHVGLALVADGRRRIGEALLIDAPAIGQTVKVKLTEPVFFDPHGEKVRA